jgi:hypothetical protein
MTTHQIVGYDPQSELPKYSAPVPEELVKQFITFGPDDPFGYDAYRLDFSVINDMAKKLDRYPPSELEYFIEPR